MASSHDGAPLYHSQAHVFQINPETKNSWLPKGEQAIPIKFVASIVDGQSGHPSRRELRIIGTDNGEAVLDAVISSKTTFTKRSHKFGQWIDDTGTVYGLGFNAETELTEFIETFQRLQKEVLSPPVATYPLSQTPSSSQSQASQAVSVSQDRLVWQQQQQDQANNNSEMNGRFSSGKGSMNIAQAQHQQYSNTLAHPGHQQTQTKRMQQQQNPPNGGSTSMNENGNQPTTGGAVAPYPRSQSMFGIQSKTGSNNNNNITSNSSMSGKVTPENDISQLSPNQWQQLKYENERLRQALEESSKNAGMWHNELLTLRTNNVKLTQALQESKAHVGEWERELSTLRGENQELKVRVSALESNDDPEKDEEYKKDLLEYKNYVEEVQGELRRKENEIEKLQRSMEEMELRHQSAPTDNGHLDDSVISGHQKQKFDVINAKLEAKINDLINVQKEFAQTIEKLYH